MILATIMSIVVQFAIGIGFLLLIRKVVLRYLKVEEVTKKQDEIYAELQQIKRLLEKNIDKGN